MFSGTYPLLGSFLSILILKSCCPSPVCHVKNTPDNAHFPSCFSHKTDNCSSSTVHSSGSASLARACFNLENKIFKYADGEELDLAVRCAFSHLLHALRAWPAFVELYSFTDRSLLHFAHIFLGKFFPKNIFFKKYNTITHVTPPSRCAGAPHFPNPTSEPCSGISTEGTLSGIYSYRYRLIARLRRESLVLCS